MRRINIETKFIIILIIIIALTIINLNFINKKLMPKLLSYAKQETNKIGTTIINDAVSKKVVEELDIDNLFIITRDKNDEIISIDFDTIIVNKVLTQVTRQVELSINFLENDKLEAIDLPNNIIVNTNNDEGIVFMIPIGVVFSNNLLANLGPKIPIKLEMIGSVITGIDTKVTNYGINNALIELYLNIEVNLNVILPFVSSKETVKTSIPLAIKMIKGKVPEYYLNGYLSSPLNVSSNM